MTSTKLTLLCAKPLSSELSILSSSFEHPNQWTELSPWILSTESVKPLVIPPDPPDPLDPLDCRKTQHLLQISTTIPLKSASVSVIFISFFQTYAFPRRSRTPLAFEKPFSSSPCVDGETLAGGCKISMKILTCSSAVSPLLGLGLLELGMGFRFVDKAVIVGPTRSSGFVEEATGCQLIWTASRRPIAPESFFGEVNGGSTTHRCASSSTTLTVTCSPSHIPLLAQPNLPLPQESTNLSSASSILFTVGKFHHRRFIPVTPIDLNGTRSRCSPDCSRRLNGPFLKACSLHIRPRVSASHWFLPELSSPTKSLRCKASLSSIQPLAKHGFVMGWAWPMSVSWVS